jgi:uncharacterized protein YndB with AHSA1/START domain
MKIQIDAEVNASPKIVWEYYTSPEHITQWNFASPEWHCPFASNDLRPGGKYLARMEAKDGSFGFDFEAVYKEVFPLEGFTYVLGDGRAVNTAFKEAGDRTQVSIEFDAEEENPVDMQQAGWQAILNNFKAYAEKA